MFCSKCGCELKEETTVCPQCGHIIEKSNISERFDGANNGKALNGVKDKIISNDIVKGLSKNMPGTWSKWCVLAIISLICGIVTLIKGINRMTRGEVYVGGDAYNFIISGNHATAFFVLTAMFVLSAVGLLIVHYVSQKN